MNKISEKEFAKLCKGIRDDRELIIKHNPIGTEEETLLWMLMSVLFSYLSLSEQEMPCFPGRPDAQTYRDAINFMLTGRKESEFESGEYLAELVFGTSQDLP